MPVIPGRIRVVRDAVLTKVAELNRELFEDFNHTEIFEGYLFAIPGDISIREALPMVDFFSSVCESNDVTCAFSISIHMLPMSRKEDVTNVFNTVLGEDSPFQRVYGNAFSIGYEQSFSDTERARKLLIALVPILGEAQGVHLALYAT